MPGILVNWIFHHGLACSVTICSSNVNSFASPPQQMARWLIPGSKMEQFNTHRETHTLTPTDVYLFGVSEQSVMKTTDLDGPLNRIMQGRMCDIVRFQTIFSLFPWYNASDDNY